MISIELISKWENTIKEVLESIKKQNFNDYEIVYADSPENNSTKNILRGYNCNIIDLPRDTGHLKALYFVHKYATGDKSLILDSTRPLKDNALSIINEKYHSHEIVIIKENSLDQSFWVN